MNELTQLAVDLARGAGERVRRRFAAVEASVSRKSSFVDLVTDADKEAEAHILGGIARRFPEHAILSEESGARGGSADVRWIVDPVDGTVNYAHRLPHFCVLIAAEVNGTLAVGVTYDPMRDEIFVAEKGKGATLNGTPIRVSPTSRLIDAVLATGFAYDRLTSKNDNHPEFCRLNMVSHGVRRMGAAGLDLAYVACGRLDAFWEPKLNAWDCAAGALLISEAGGTISNQEGRAFDYGAGGVLATNGALHDVVRRALVSARLHPPNSRVGLEEFLPPELVRDLGAAGG